MVTVDAVIIDVLSRNNASILNAARVTSGFGPSGHWGQ